MALIHIVEDDNSVRELICCALKSAGFEVESFASGEDFLSARGSGATPGLLLLDIMLPGMDGLTLFSRIKNEGPIPPVIFLTAKNSEIDKVTGLNMGADDYIAKPFGVLELIARVNASLRRVGRGNAGGLAAGAIKMDLDGRKVSVYGEAAGLTYKEFEMLRLFMQNPNVVISRDSFLNSIWGVEAQIETRTVDMHVKTLRAKLKSAGSYIKTVRNVGYEFSPEDK